ncbi:nucleotidyltransferase family protein [Miniphocaeibacter halophilus]|uniref:Nucleotidyltransferase family protein n=1 Tax=Miniphocaeibacter halophilus TaxID=2931922 RepID=A0AC61MT11_9FIRM|nr:nucleotidyltransferase family protein [Miniphocaeibacter halophilus]QQK07964.1 nucleotidyltransferase family protein [Miniphocaeibacter halophilus]
MAVSCIVMASGMSKRMNENKLLLTLNKKMIFEYILDTISRIDFDEVIVVTRFKEIIDYSKKYKYKVVINKNFEEGQASSIRLGVNSAKKNNDYMFFVADQPFIREKTINYILEKNKENKGKIIVPYYNGLKGNPVVFGNIFRKDLLNLSGDKGGSIVIKQNKDRVKNIFIKTEDSFENFDIDNKKDYEVLKRKYEK